MAELPEDLQVVKTEGPQLPEAEAQPRLFIKERLHLHVKRRIHQHQEQEPPQQQTHPNIQTITHSSGITLRAPEAAVIKQLPQSKPIINVNSTANDVTAPQSTSKRKEKAQQKEPAKIRKPYQKRLDKNTTEIHVQMQETSLEGGKTRKYKRQKKQATTVGVAVPAGVGNTVIPFTKECKPFAFTSSDAQCLSPAVDELSGGGGDDTDGRDLYMRDKEKCPDILGMVLSAKKRALMQNAEVQDFLGQIMAAFETKD